MLTPLISQIWSSINVNSKHWRKAFCLLVEIGGCGILPSFSFLENWHNAFDKRIEIKILRKNLLNHVYHHCHDTAIYVWISLVYWPSDDLLRLQITTNSTTICYFRQQITTQKAGPCWFMIIAVDASPNVHQTRISCSKVVCHKQFV